jgi:hypothetical protein
MRVAVPLTGTPFGLLQLPGWFMVLACPPTLLAALAGLVFQGRTDSAWLIPILAAGAVVGYRLVRCGVVATATELTRHGFFSTRVIPAADIIEVTIERQPMSALEAWTSPYHERYGAAFVVSGGGRVTSPALVGGVKRRQWNNIAADLDVLGYRTQLLARVLNLPDPPPRVERRRHGRTVTSRPWRAFTRPD